MDQRRLLARAMIIFDADRVDSGDRANVNQDAVVDALVRTNERYRWRCYLCRLFARQYQPDRERAKLARDYAYNHRKMIHEGSTAA